MSYAEPLIGLMKRRDYVPLPINRVAERLKIPEAEREAFYKEVKELQRSGTIVKLKKDRLCLPRDADLCTGRIRFRQSGSAVLVSENLENGSPAEPVQIKAEDTWVALHNDRVLVRLIPTRHRYRTTRDRKGRPRAEPEPQGEVIRILERARETLAGTLKRSKHAYYVIPDDPRIIQDIIVPDPATSSLNPKPKVDDKVVVRLLEWEQRHLNPEGEIIEVLGKTHTPGAEYLALLRQYDLNPEFPEAVLQEVEKLPAKVTLKDRRGRLDLRKKHIFTIDPDDAKDFDDALHVERLENGNWLVGVHIADVAHYVKPGTRLDEEARRRGNSTYLVGKVIPMLPHQLSNGLCSLVEGEDRLTKSVFLTFSPKGHLIDKETRFANSVIRSAKRLTYKQAYALLNEDNLEKVRELPLPPAHQTGSTGRALTELSNKELAALQRDVRQLWALASALRKKRMAGGSLDLDMPETKIYVDAEGYAERIEKVENDESHQLIEEFMLCANEAVDKTLRKERMAIIHRVHDKPEPEKLEELSEYMATVGIETGDLTSSRKHITRLLAKIREHPQSHILRIQFLRSMKQACYRASPDGHWGLNKSNYTHFTSPIRRYSDLIVHRLFDSHLAKLGDPTAPKNPIVYNQNTLAAMAEHVSITEQNSTEAERESVKIKLLEFFEREATKKDKTSFEAVITDVRNHGLFVELTESMAYGMIHVSSLRDDLYVYNGERGELSGRRRKRRFRVGDKILVQAYRVDRFKRQIDFTMAGATDSET